MIGKNLIKLYAEEAFNQAKDKAKSEKMIRISEEDFLRCIVNIPKHHQTTCIERGFLRTYHKSFWTENPGRFGKTYHHGVVYIINKDAKANRTYEIKNATTVEINRIIGNLRHRLIRIELDSLDNHIYTFTPQRMSFEE